MKRIPTRYAVFTGEYTIDPDTYVRIIDYPSLNDLYNDKTVGKQSGEIWKSGKWDTIAGWGGGDKYWKASVRLIEPWYDPETQQAYLILKICTAVEEY